MIKLQKRRDKPQLRYLEKGQTTNEKIQNI